jgi:hypothetical protein
MNDQRSRGPLILIILVLALLVALILALLLSPRHHHGENRAQAMPYYLDPRRPWQYTVKDFDPDKSFYAFEVPIDAPSITPTPKLMSADEQVLLGGKAEPFEPTPLVTGVPVTLVITVVGKDGLMRDYILKVTRPRS